jgi:hypothetical protein
LIHLIVATAPRVNFFFTIGLGAVEGEGMADYRISFFKNLVSSNGHRFKCLQGQIDICGSAGPAEAVEAASREFELRHGLSDWRFHADLVEIANTDRADQRPPISIAAA